MKRRASCSTGLRLGVNRVVAFERHLYAGDHQQRAEDEHHPVERFEQRRADEDERGAQSDGSNHAPKEDTVLVRRRRAKCGE